MRSIFISRADRGLTALFGRSGSGKTSVVNAIAGLYRPARGRILVDGRTLTDTERGIAIRPHRRRIGYVFQEGRLFPHLTVRQNLMFGRWFARPARDAVRLDEVVALLALDGLLDRRPGRLSGGEKQRVALGRALLADPRLLLMDEPLAALDAERKDEILPYIERLRDEAGVPIVYVSHSVAEVVRLANTIVLIADGRVRTLGPGRRGAGARRSPALGRRCRGGGGARGTCRAARPALGAERARRRVRPAHRAVARSCRRCCCCACASAPAT